MKFPIFIARRYLFSKKTHNVINIISAISVLGVCIGTAALIIVLSVFNGFESLVVSLYNSFDPDIRITISKGKTFDENIFPLDGIRKIEGVQSVVEVLEENALLKYKEKQYIATIKGVGSGYTKVCGLDSMIINGEFLLNDHKKQLAVIGYGVAHNLSLEMYDAANPIRIFVPKKGEVSLLSPENAFNQEAVWPAGIFSIQHEFDSKYIIVSLPFVRNLLESPSRLSAVEIKLAGNADMESVQQEITSLLGEKYEVKNRFEQHELLYKIIKSEKWAVYFILSFILLIATFNMVGSLTMLILDKKRDIAVLRSMGADLSMIRKIFFAEGMFIAAMGAIIGMLIGLAVCLVQIYFGIIPIGTNGSFVVDSYPVVIEAMDIVYVLLTVMCISLLAIIYPLRKLSQEELNVAQLRNE